MGGRVCCSQDHKPLVFIWNDKGLRNSSPRLIRLFSKLYDYNFTMRHIPGGKNVKADFLSKCPSNHNSDEVSVEDKEGVVGLLDGFVLAKDVISCQEWEQASASDRCQTLLKRFICSGWPREGQIGDQFISYSKVKDDLSVEGVLIMRGSSLIPPAALRNKLIALAHKGHVGITGT